MKFTVIVGPSYDEVVGPRTVQRYRRMPPSSVEPAPENVTGMSSSVEEGPAIRATGGASATATWTSAASAFPTRSATVSRTLYVPPESNRCVTDSPVPTMPSPCRAIQNLSVRMTGLSNQNRRHSSNVSSSFPGIWRSATVSRICTPDGGAPAIASSVTTSSSRR